MLPMTRNVETGFLESDGGQFTFNSAKKVRFLELCRDYKEKENKWPDLGSVCDQVGVAMRTFYAHLEMDEKFKEAYDEITLHGEATLTSKMYELATKNPMYMFGWLRRHYPQRWNPDQRLSISTDSAGVKGATTEALQIFDAEIVPNLPSIAQPNDEKH